MTERSFSRYTVEVAPERYEEAVDALLDLPADGWQENGLTFTFWLATDAESRDDVAARLARLRGVGRLYAEPEPGGWEEGWRRAHKPVTVGPLTVRPPWAPCQPDTLDLVIDIGMAFGTGAHATTRQCLTVLDELPRGSLLDIGTGTGILALAALRLGYAPVFALDYDEEALEAAERNARRNDLHPKLFLADVRDRSVELPATDIALANMALKPILALGERCALARADGLAHPRHLVLAGLLRAQVDEVVTAFPAYELCEQRVDGDWVLLHFECA